MLSQSLWNRAVSYDSCCRESPSTHHRSQSLWNRAVSYDTMNVCYVESERSQSLWNRAVSYDV